MRTWEDVEATVNRLVRRDLLTHRHLKASFNILRNLPQHPSRRFLKQLSDLVAIFVSDFHYNEICEITRTLYIMGWSEMPFINDFLQRLTTNESAIQSMTLQELATLIHHSGMSSFINSDKCLVKAMWRSGMWTVLCEGSL